LLDLHFSDKKTWFIALSNRRVLNESSHDTGLLMERSSSLNMQKPMNGRDAIPDGYPHMTMPQLAANPGTATQQSSLGGVLWRRKGLILVFLLIGLGGGYFAFTRQPEIFSANSVISVYRGKANVETGSAVDSVVELAPGIALIQAEITSDSVLLAAIASGQLTNYSGMPSDANQMVGVLRSGLTIREAVVGSQSKNQTVAQVGFSSGDPMFCTLTVNAVAAAYREHLSGRHRQTIDTVVGFFREARDTILPQLNDLEQKYTDFRASAPLEWSSSGEAVNPFRQDALTVEASLTTLKSEMRQIDSKLRLIDEATADQPSAILALKDLQFLLDDVRPIEPSVSAVTRTPQADAEVAIQETLVPKMVQSSVLKNQFGEKHPVRLQLEQEIEATRRALSDLDRTRQERKSDSSLQDAQPENSAIQLLASYTNGLRKKRQLLAEDIAELESRLVETRNRAHNLIKFENENASFVRRISRYQTMLDSFDSQLEKASLPLLTPGLEVEVLRPAGMGALVGPMLSRNLMMGGLLGAAVGCLFGWLIDWSERTFRSPDEVAAALDLPILAHLPLMMLSRKKKKKTKKRGVDDPEEVSDPLDRVSPAVLVVHEPHSAGAEAIRGVRTGLFCSRTKQLEFQIIQVTSAMPGDGKSTVAANLAASIARANKRVIIIDADLRRPTQNELFGIDSKVGLTSVLNGEVSLSDAIRPTAVEGLDLLTTGPKPSNPAEAVMLPEFSQLLDDLRAEYDMVIVDSPPLLACTDASNISSNADGVIFVMRIGRNTKPLARRATQMLRTLHVNLVGVIVNAVGDSGYSATYASSWSTQYGGLGTEYAYSYNQDVTGRYLAASKGQSLSVTGRRAMHDDLPSPAEPVGSLNGHVND